MRRKTILESNIYNTGLFDLGMPMFVIECLSYVLDNACKSGVIYVQYNDVRVDTELTRRNIQCCIT